VGRDGDGALAGGGYERRGVEGNVLDVVEESGAAQAGLREDDRVVLGVEVAFERAPLDLREAVEPRLGRLREVGVGVRTLGPTVGVSLVGVGTVGFLVLFGFETALVFGL
jgi:hypothetical protein